MYWFIAWMLHDHEDKDFRHTEPSKNGQATTVIKGTMDDLMRAQQEEFAIGTIHPEHGVVTKTTLAYVGGPFWNLSITFSEEPRAKISAAQKGKELSALKDAMNTGVQHV